MKKDFLLIARENFAKFCLFFSILGGGFKILKNRFCIELLGSGRPRPILCPYLVKSTNLRQSGSEKS